MSDDQLSDADKAYLLECENLAKQIASMALIAAFKRSDVPKDEFLEDAFLGEGRIREIYEGKANNITLVELVRLSIALGMIVDLDFESLPSRS